MKKLYTVLLLLCALSMCVFAKTQKLDVDIGEKHSAVLEAEDSVKYTFATDENGIWTFTFENILFTEDTGISRKPRLEIEISDKGKTLSEVYYDADEGESLVVAEGLEAGEYTLTVTNAELFSTVGFDVSFSFTQHDYVEKQPANEISDAGKAEIGETYFGAVTTRDNTDYYTFEMPWDGYALIAMNCTDAKTVVYYDESEESFHERSFILNDPTKYYIQRVGLSKGTYYVSVSNFEDYTDPMYSLWVKVYESDGFESENNNVPSRADEIVFGKTYKANLSREEDEDVYAFELSGKSEVEIDFSDSIAEKDEHFRFTLSDENSVISHFDTYNSLKDKITLDEGRYYFKVYCAYPQNYHGESYSVKIQAELLEQKTDEQDKGNEDDKTTAEPIEPEPEEDMIIELPAFVDVVPDEWFYDEVNAAFYKGLVKGRENGFYDPYANVTLAEAVALASRLHAANSNAEAGFDEGIGEKWYDVYVSYAISAGIIEDGDFDEYDRAATRREVAYIMDGALGKEQTDDSEIIIPDVNKDEKYAQSIYRLYSLGVLKGNDESGSFYPERNITRAEIAAVVLRSSAS